jgi:hypothetical protein
MLKVCKVFGRYCNLRQSRAPSSLAPNVPLMVENLKVDQEKIKDVVGLSII